MQPSSELGLHHYAFGYSAAMHASKLPAWRLRLSGATTSLRTAADRGDRSEVVQLLGDVWFWVGRLAGELMAAAVDPAYASEAEASARAITDAYSAIYADPAYASEAEASARAITDAYSAIYAASAVLNPQRIDTQRPETWAKTAAVGRAAGPTRDRLPGGLADRYRPEQFDPAALRAGTRVELEHTTDRNIAREIAMDHLVEHPDYYRALARMEDQLSQRARARAARLLHQR